MGTRSFIGKIEGTKIRGIYCHWDGYPHGVGRILLENYKDEDRLDSLISLGSLSSLQAELEPAKGVTHSFEDPAPNVTVAYHRDRGERRIIREFDDQKDFNEYLDTSWYDYVYLWENGDWKFGHAVDVRANNMKSLKDYLN